MTTSYAMYDPETGEINDVFTPAEGEAVPPGDPKNRFAPVPEELAGEQLAKYRVDPTTLRFVPRPKLGLPGPKPE